MRTRAAALACLLAGCSESAPPAPPPRVQRLVLGQSVDARLALTDSHHAVFTISQGDPSRQGLYIYGPLP